MMKISTFLIAFFATVIQCYDYALFGLSAGALSKTFMPGNSTDAQLMNFFAIFSFAVISRPIGAILFGIIGDNYGRVVSLKISILLSAISTLFIGIMPSFDQVGYVATILLALCRMVFLMSLAGEVDAVRIYVLEKSKKFKNLGSGIISTCSQVGALIASVAYHYALNSEIEYLWRINFIVGALCGSVLLILRKYLIESAEFVNYHAKNRGRSTFDYNILKPIIQHKSRFISTLMISGCAGGVYHFLIIFFNTFLTDVLKMLSKNNSQFLNMCFIATYSCMAIVSGFLADRINPYKQIIVSILLSIIIVAALQFIVVDHSAPFIICVAAGMLIALMPFYTVPLQIITPLMFTLDIRMRLYSLSRSLGSIIFSANSPLICMLIWNHTHSVHLVFAFLLFLLSIILCNIIMVLKRWHNSC